MSRQAVETDPPLDDIELARRIGGADEAAFETVMRRYNGRLFRVARSILKDDSEAEDALQEAYLAAYQHIAEFRGGAKLSTWLTRIVINQALGRLRKQKRAGVIVLFADRPCNEANEEESAMAQAETESPESATLRAEVRRLLEQKIDALPAAFSTVFILREVEELTVAETAECLSIPDATVRTRLFRAKAMLRESLALEFGLETANVYGFAGERCDRIVRAVLDRLRRRAPGPGGSAAEAGASDASER